MTSAVRPVEKARRVYKEMQANIRSLERNVLKLIRHPDTTQEQLAEVRTTYVAMWQSYMDVKATLKEKFPGPRWGFNEPWNMPE